MSSDERAKLRILLDHWVEHNKEHSQEFSEWADRAKALGETEVGEEMLRAAQAMDESSGLLSQALKRLGEG